MKYYILNTDNGSVTEMNFESEVQLNQWLEINPNFVNSLYNLGIVHKELGNYQKAKFYYEKVIKINPKQVNSYNNLGVILDELGDTQKAKAYYNAAIKINPNYTEPYWNTHVLATNIDEAESILKKLYKIDNTHIKAKIMISALEGYKGNLSSFNKILEWSTSKSISRTNKSAPDSFKIFAASL